MRSMNMAIFRLYAKKPPKSIPRKQVERNRGTGTHIEENEGNNDEYGNNIAEKVELRNSNDNIPDFERIILKLYRNL